MRGKVDAISGKVGWALRRDCTSNYYWWYSVCLVVSCHRHLALVVLIGYGWATTILVLLHY